MLASLLTVPIYHLITVTIHTDEQLCKLTHFLSSERLAQLFCSMNKGLGVTHKS